MSLRIFAALIVLAAPSLAHAGLGAKVVSYQVGAGSFERSGRGGTFVTWGLRGEAMTTKDRPIQFFGYTAIRSSSASGADLFDWDLGFGGRVLPQRPLSYSADGTSVVRLTASAAVGFSLASADTPFELTGGVALCKNRGAFSGGLIELVFRPNDEPHSGTDLGPWGGLRVSGFW